MCGLVCVGVFVAVQQPQHIDGQQLGSFGPDCVCVCQNIYVSLSHFMCIALWCMCVRGGQQVCHAAELVASPGVFSQQGNTANPDANSAEQMAERVSMPELCQGSEGAVQPVRRQHSSK